MAATPHPHSSTTEAPVLLLMGSGDRRYREYIVAAVSRHFRLWLLDAHEPSWQLPYVEGTSLLDTKNLDELLAEAKKVMQRLPVAGVFTYDESLVHAAARLAEALGLPGSAPDAVLACRDKATTRARLTAADVPQPACTPVSTAAAARRAADATGYPVVVKARGLAGSLGVVRADHGDAVEEAFEAASSANWPGVPRYEADVLVEEYLTGPEISIDAVVVDGVCTPMIVARKQVGMDPYFEETGHTVDAADPLLQDSELLDQLDRIHKALGFEHGSTHTEFKLTPKGPRLVEINARLGGDFIPSSECSPPAPIPPSPPPKWQPDSPPTPRRSRRRPQPSGSSTRSATARRSKRSSAPTSSGPRCTARSRPPPRHPAGPPAPGVHEPVRLCHRRRRGPRAGHRRRGRSAHPGRTAVAPLTD